MPNGYVQIGTRQIFALFLFADLRGFTQWATQHQDMVGSLLQQTYNVATGIFDHRRRGLVGKIVKFLGDGFFAVNEYTIPSRRTGLCRRLRQTLLDIRQFRDELPASVAEAGLPETAGLGFGFGLSSGGATRITRRGFPADYVGYTVNIAARLCHHARPQGIVVDGELQIPLQEVQDATNQVGVITDEFVTMNLPGIGERSVLVSENIHM